MSGRLGGPLRGQCPDDLGVEFSVLRCVFLRAAEGRLVSATTAGCARSGARAVEQGQWGKGSGARAQGGVDAGDLTKLSSLSSTNSSGALTAGLVCALGSCSSCAGGVAALLVWPFDKGKRASSARSSSLSSCTVAGLVVFCARAQDGLECESCASFHSLTSSASTSGFSRPARPASPRESAISAPTSSSFSSDRS